MLIVEKDEEDDDKPVDAGVNEIKIALTESLTKLSDSLNAATSKETNIAPLVKSTEKGLTSIILELQDQNKALLKALEKLSKPTKEPVKKESDEIKQIIEAIKNSNAILAKSIKSFDYSDVLKKMAEKPEWRHDIYRTENGRVKYITSKIVEK